MQRGENLDSKGTQVPKISHTVPSVKPTPEGTPLSLPLRMTRMCQQVPTMNLFLQQGVDVGHSIKSLHARANLAKAGLWATQVGHKELGSAATTPSKRSCSGEA